MFLNWKKVCVFLFLFAFATISVSAQKDLNKIDGEVAKMLLKKDLQQAIKEAESASTNDLRSLLWRLSLYRRAVHEEKYTTILKQIIVNSEFEKSRSSIGDNIIYALKDTLFQDIGTLQMYLQNVEFYGDIYEKFTKSCLQKRSSCDINGFDKWLAQKVAEDLEAKDKNGFNYQNFGGYNWLGLRIDWREKFGLDNSEILNHFIEDVRKNPTDLDIALRYLQFLRNAQDINWLAETFASEQAYDYYELGEKLSNENRYSQKTENERQQIYRIASLFLQKSLTLSFNKQDIFLINSRQLSRASVPPNIKNYEKQLRFWTKTELAETYKNLGEAQNAQPIVEELMNTDTSDIMSGKPVQLAGAVQAASGARIVESKILSEQGTRQNSYEYWNERIAYYRGRQENERIFDAYKQSLAVVPFDLSNENSGENRLYFIRRFADFAEDEFERYADDDPKDLSDEEKAHQSYWREAENFLRTEFEKTNSNTQYSYKLAEIIEENKFEKLSEEILSRNPELLVNAVKLDLISLTDGLLYVFFKSEAVPQEKKDLIFDRIFKVVEGKNIGAAWIICEALINIEEKPNYMARLVPVLVKNLKIAETNFDSSSKSDENYDELEGLKNKYVEILFSTYLSANDWKSAEKLLLGKYSFDLYSLNYSLERLSLNSAKNGAFADAAKYWKIKANLDRRNLENLGSLKRYAAVVEILREFYKKMQIEESYSPIPAKALNILK